MPIRSTPYMSPVKPINATAMRLAVTRAMGSPLMHRGMVSLASIRSLNPAMSMRAKRNPTEAPTALTMLPRNP
jgi:hypothetical protein